MVIVKNIPRLFCIFPRYTLVNEIIITSFMECIYWISITYKLDILPLKIYILKDIQLLRKFYRTED